MMFNRQYSIFSTNKVIPKNLFAENVYISAYLSVQKLRKLNKWRTKEEVAGLNTAIYKSI